MDSELVQLLARSNSCVDFLWCRLGEAGEEGRQEVELVMWMNSGETLSLPICKGIRKRKIFDVWILQISKMHCSHYVSKE